MTAVGNVADREARPAYVRFERVAVEDKPASRTAGHYVAKNVDYALITPAYSKDVMKHDVKSWLPRLQSEVAAGRMPQSWADQYETQYKAWLNGQEIPLHGVPIKGWGVISPAQQETLIRMNIVTVEDLAGVNDEGIKRIGMGAMDLKVKARAWLSQLKDKGPATAEIAALKSENEVLKANQATQARQIQELLQQVRALQLQPVPDNTRTVSDTAAESEIAITDILVPEPEPQQDEVLI